MRSRCNRVRLYWLVFILSVQPNVFGQDSVFPDAAEMVHRYRQSLSWMKTMSVKLDITVDVDEINSAGLPHISHIIFRQNNGQTEWLGEQEVFEDRSDTNPSYRRRIQQVMTESRHLSVIGLASEPIRRAQISDHYTEYQKDLLDTPGKGGPVCGRIYGNSHKSVADLLSEASHLSLRQAPEEIMGELTYVVEADTKYGRVSAWIAPDKGYSALKWSIEKTPDDLFDTLPVGQQRVEKWSAVCEVTELQEINGVFVATDSKFALAIQANGKPTWSTYRYKMSDIQIDPDFDALGAFKFNLPDGLRVNYIDFPGISYIWQGGELVPNMDMVIMAQIEQEADKLFKELKEQGQANSTLPVAARAVRSDTQEDISAQPPPVQVLAKANPRSYLWLYILLAVAIIAAVLILSFRRENQNVTV